MNIIQPFCESHSEIKDSLDELKEKIEKFETLTIKNGKEKKVHISEIVKDIYYDVELIRDLNRVHTIFKKYRIYFFMIMIIMLLLGINYQEVIMKILK